MEEDDIIEMDANEEVVKKESYPNFIIERFAFLLEDDDEEELILSDFELVRPVKCNIGLLNMAHGSVKLYQGDTCVICAVYGPSDVRMSKELPHRAAVDVLYRPKITGVSQLCQNSNVDSTWEERAIENIVTGVFESTIILDDDLGAGFNIILHEYENDGCILATCVNAVSIALMKAGCSIRHPVAAVTVMFTKDGRLIIDPNSTQLKNGCQAVLTFVFTNQGSLLYSNMQGYASKAVVQVSMMQAQLAASELFKFQMKIVRHDNCQGQYANTEEEIEEVKPELYEDESSTKLKFTDLKVTNSVSSDSDYEDIEDKDAEVGDGD